MTRVRIKQGELEGTLEKLTTGDTYVSFKGVPYAKPPIGDLRFRAPQPAESWSGVRDASNHGNVCPQWDIITGQEIDGSEDCLFLNVYTPSLSCSKTPVMVWFHGGGFQSGSGDSHIYGPEYLVEEGVVVVTANYRLEALGFLCMDTKEVPGNAGMKDQVAVLRWVRDNIAQFGGDPQNVTIFGESAGGSSVTYHILSPMSKGLFHKVIAQSGCFFNNWRLSDCKTACLRLGKYFGNETEDFDELAKYLKKQPSKNLVKMADKIATKEEKLRGLTILFYPSIEKSFEGEECFLPKSPLELLAEGNFTKVPMILGYNACEGLMMIRNVEVNIPKMLKSVSLRLPYRVQISASKSQLPAIAKKVEDFYFKGKSNKDEVLQSVVDLESDVMFSYQIMNLSRMLSQLSQNPIYLYKFSFDGGMNLPKMTMGLGNMKGACHADELFYMFKCPIEVEPESDEWKVLRRFTKMWTNFAKYSDPTPKKDDLISVEWKSISSTNVNYLKIDHDLQQGVRPDKERFDFWDEIYNDLFPTNKRLKSNL